MNIDRMKAGPRMSMAVRHAGTVYLAGQVPDNVSEDVAGQTRQVLAKIDALLAEAGTDKSRLLSATIYLRDMATFSQMNAAWDAWVDPNNTPARASVEAKLARPEFMVEISIIAATEIEKKLF
ncbi:MAG TPA: RidA family protein [Candidatus Acidoferrales bacterium]|nr:RidA family protein [Candidatus Acidoferrales bacterium]